MAEESAGIRKDVTRALRDAGVNAFIDEAKRHNARPAECIAALAEWSARMMASYRLADTAIDRMCALTANEAKNIRDEKEAK